jgi:hypothetical protein
MGPLHQHRVQLLHVDATVVETLQIKGFRYAAGVVGDESWACEGVRDGIGIRNVGRAAWCDAEDLNA